MMNEKELFETYLQCVDSYNIYEIQNKSELKEIILSDCEEIANEEDLNKVIDAVWETFLKTNKGEN